MSVTKPEAKERVLGTLEIDNDAILRILQYVPCAEQRLSESTERPRSRTDADICSSLSTCGARLVLSGNKLETVCVAEGCTTTSDPLASTAHEVIADLKTLAARAEEFNTHV